MALIRGTGGRDSLRGTAKKDKIKAKAGNDKATGKAGPDKIVGDAGHDKLFGANGNDVINGGRGNDKLNGGAGDDTLNGGVGTDQMIGGAGNDKIIAGPGNDFLYGGPGSDTAIFSGNFADYDFAPVAGGIQVTHARGTMADGSDFLDTTFEFLQFADQVIDTTSTAPVAGGDTGTVAENAVLNGSSVLSNDFDFQVLLGQESLTVSAVNGSAANLGVPITLASGAILSVNPNGTYTYNPNGVFDSLQPGQTANDSFTYTVSDGNGGTDTATVDITITGTNSAPSVTAGAAVTLNVLNLLQVQIDPSITIADPDDVNMEGATVAITDGFVAGDQLIFNNTAEISGNYNAATGVLTLTGTASIAAYEAALESVEFRPNVISLIPLQVSLGEREITYAVNDGNIFSPGETTATATIDVILL